MRRQQKYKHKEMTSGTDNFYQSSKADSEIDQALELLNKKRLKIDDARGELET